jgi:hypothetical protein
MSNACILALNTIESISSSLTETKQYIAGESLRDQFNNDSISDNNIDEMKSNPKIIEAAGDDGEFIQGEIGTIFLEDFDENMNKIVDNDFEESDANFSEMPYVEFFR